jgi:hypothetical protein
VHVRKPKAYREKSAETYLLARGVESGALGRLVREWPDQLNPILCRFYIIRFFGQA